LEKLRCFASIAWQFLQCRVGLVAGAGVCTRWCTASQGLAGIPLQIFDFTRSDDHFVLAGAILLDEAGAEDTERTAPLPRPQGQDVLPAIRSLVCLATIAAGK